MAREMRLLALVASGVCGSLGVVQFVVFFSSRAVGNGAWVVVLTLLAGVAAVLLVVMRSPVVGACLGLGAAALANLLWAGGTIDNRILRDTEVLLVLPIALACGALLAVTLVKRLIPRGGETAGTVVLDRGMATALLTSHDWPCAKCAYNLRGNLSGVCPECQTPVELKLDAPHGMTPLMLLRVVLGLLAVREGVALYSNYASLSRYFSPGFFRLSTWQTIWMFSTGAATLITLLWAGLVLIRSLLSENGRLTERRLIVAGLRVMGFGFATSALLAVLFIIVWR